MYSPIQSNRARGSAGEPLPTVWKSFEELGITFRRGELVLVCAGSGTGKSVMMLSYALKSRSPALYFSADSNAFTQLARTISIVTRTPMTESKQLILDGKLERVEKNLKPLAIRFVYEASPSLDTIEMNLESYFEIYGHYPALMIVDNVTNVSFEGQGELNEAFGLEGLMDWLNDLGRKKDSCVVGLHHVKEEYNNGDKPIPLKGVKNQIHRVPAAVLTIHKPDGDEFRRGVSPVKNRDGEADPSGYRFAELSFNGARMQIDDY